jgi:transposase
MAQNFIACDRDQVLLMAPSLRDWLPADHLAWFVISAVEGMDLAAFYAVYRLDGQGRPAHEPAMMVTLLVYAYARGQRSSRRIERACVEDVAFRVIAANAVPDHTTIARFRQRHQDALGGLFGDVLALCAEAGLAGVEVVAVDGTKAARQRVRARQPRLRTTRERDPGGGRRGRPRRGRTLRRSPRRRAAGTADERARSPGVVRRGQAAVAAAARGRGQAGRERAAAAAA